MDKNVISGIGISLIYGKSMWHILLCEGVKSFLEEENIRSYSLKLSHESGDHIRLVLRTEKEKCRALAEKANVFFKDFFFKWPSFSKVKNLRESSLFQDFKNNTIHYGAFTYEDTIEPNATFEILLRDISLILIQVFQSYQESTLECNIEIMLELLTVFCHSVGFSNKEAIDFFDSLLQKTYQKYDSESLEKVKKNLQENFETNKNEICGYLREKALDVQWIETAESWEKSWDSAVKTYIKGNGVSKRTYQELINTLETTFNFKDNMMVYYLLSNGLERL
ncbi:hypothetical protein BUL40_09330 [Croceivirga radicis]|uniref:Thiopeptide-type bacteriocin biosynthesis domain-containing protein n=1 Tax=Croceivirga radicis TaxID=1929488 RepID=A0A1V6LR96_9FLAO|nr:lantibiotic dehydratase C-terminal domain-containing protein [Croceivirga radicis]OQD42713.1 hypothetical protein BUL40_09330 [Croceivirga radicis]